MFKLEFDTSNAAFEEQPATETCRILRNIAKRIEYGNLEGRCVDINGNHVGNWSFSGDGE